MPTLEDALGSRANITLLRFLTAVRGPLSGNEIAGRLGLPQSSVRKALQRLIETGLVTRIDIGRNAGYELDQNLAFVRMALIPLFRYESNFRKLVGAHERYSEAVERS